MVTVKSSVRKHWSIRLEDPDLATYFAQLRLRLNKEFPGDEELKSQLIRALRSDFFHEEKLSCGVFEVVSITPADVGMGDSDFHSSDWLSQFSHAVKEQAGLNPCSWRLILESLFNDREMLTVSEYYFVPASIHRINHNSWIPQVWHTDGSGPPIGMFNLKFTVDSLRQQHFFFCREIG